jgi:hypothetical protein
VAAVARASRRAPWLPRHLTLGSSRLIAGCAVGTSLLFGGLFLVGAITSDVPYLIAVLFFVFGFVIGGLFGSALDAGRTLVGSGNSRRAPWEVRDLAIEAFGSEGWNYGGETPERVWYSRQLHANFLTFGLLLFLGVVPALIYLASSRRTQRAEVAWRRIDEGTRVEFTIAPKGWGGRQIAAALTEQLR